MANTDPVEMQIIINATNAIIELGDLTHQTDDWATKIENVRLAAQKLVDQFGISFKSASSVLQQVNSEITSTGASMGAFGGMARQGFQELNQGAQNSVSGIDILSVAIGTLTSRMVYQLFNAIRDTFNQAITLANDYAKALYQISVAQDVLARGGIDIVQQDLVDMAHQLVVEFGVFSKVEMTDAVAQAALLTQNFSFTKDQIKEVVQIASALAIQSNDVKNLPNYIEQITRALTTGTAPAALSKLGIDIKASSTEMKDMETSLYGTTKGLTDQQVAAAALDLMMQHLNPEMKDFSTYQDTLPGKADKLNASWKDLLTNAGNLFNPIKAGLIDVANWIIKATENIQIFGQAIWAGAVAPFIVLGEVAQGHIKTIDQLKSVYQEAVDSIFKGLRQTTEGMGDLSNATNTATQAAGKATAALIDLSGVDLSSMVNSITSMSDQMDKTTQSFNDAQTKAQEDFATKSARDYEDYQIKRAQTVADYNTKVADNNAKYHAQEADAEAKFQEQMRQLREHYLFDLEDALRARDAKQVIRLMEKYQMDKTDAQNTFALQQKTQAEQHTQELVSNKKAEDDKLAQDDAAYKLKEARALEDFNTSQARAKKQYDQQIADEKKSWDEKLQMEAQKLGDQYKLNDTQIQELYQLFSDYLGPNGKVDGLYDYSYQSLVDRSKQLLSTLSAVINSYGSAIAGMAKSAGGTVINPPASGSESGGGSAHGGRHAEGGMDIVNSATQTGYGATYGEAGPEAHIFLPLTNTPSVPNISSIGGGGSGRLSLDITLSPDLVSRVTENTLNKVADVVTKVRRSK